MPIEMSFSNDETSIIFSYIIDQGFEEPVANAALDYFITIDFFTKSREPAEETYRTLLQQDAVVENFDWRYAGIAYFFMPEDEANEKIAELSMLGEERIMKKLVKYIANWYRVEIDQLVTAISGAKNNLTGLIDNAN